MKPVVLEQETTPSGKKVVFTNDVDSLTKIDTNYQQMIKELTKDFKLTQDDISSVKSTQTSTGNTYSIITTKGTDTNQVDVIYNQDTKQVKVLDVATVPQKLIQPAPRPTTTVSKVDYNNDDITLIIKKSVEDFNVPSFTVSQIIKIEKSKTPFGFNYVIEIDTTDGKAVLIATISTDRKVNVVRYRAPAVKPQPAAEAPSKTEFTVDSVTGSQVQSSNDIKVIRDSQAVRTVMTELVKSSTVPKDSEVVSIVTKTLPNTIQSTLVVKSETTSEQTVIVTVTDKKTNEVKVIAQKPVPQEQVDQPEITKIIPQTVVTGTIYDEVIKKDVPLQNVIKQVKDNHPEIKEPKPTKVVVDKVGEKTVTEVNYKNVTVTVVTDSKTGKVEEVSSSPLPKESDRKPVVLEQTITDDGAKIVTSNKIEQIEKVVPNVRPAITEVSKIIPIKTEDIKTITTSVDENTYTVITVDQTNKVKEVTFTYEPEKPKPVKVIDLQEFSEPAAPTKPKDIVYETVPVEDKPQITKTIEKLNRTNTVVKNDVTEVIKVERAVTNFVEEYKVQVRTKNSEVATIVMEVNPTTQETNVVDVIRYVPQK